jgi:hypothetical protein
MLLRLKPLLTAIEAHNGLTGLIAEETHIYENAKTSQFDAIWVFNPVSTMVTFQGSARLLCTIILFSAAKSVVLLYFGQ